MLFRRLPGKDEASEWGTCAKRCPAVHLQKEEEEFSASLETDGLFSLAAIKVTQQQEVWTSCETISLLPERRHEFTVRVVIEVETWEDMIFFFFWREQIPVQEPEKETGDPLWV